MEFLDWTHYGFMQHALLAILAAAPIFALLGTIVVTEKLAFFSDVIGHSALTGVAIGVLFGLSDPTPVMIAFAIALAFGLNFFKLTTQSSSDTVLGVFFAFCVALGVVILSRGGGFAKYTSYLVGDILSVTTSEVKILFLTLLFVTVFWYFFSSRLFLASVHPSLARSRGVSVFWLESTFSAVLAVVVMLSVKYIGILIINSFLILPAATARNLAHNIRSYVLWSVGLSLAAGIAGLVASYYAETASGATIVLVSALFYSVSVVHFFRRKR